VRRDGRARITAATAVVAAAAALAGCAGTAGQQVRVEAATTVARPTTTSRAPDCAEMLPVEGLAAQLLMTMVTSPGAATELVASGLVGGFGLKGNQSADVAEEIAAAVAASPLPAMVAADEEGGTVQRLRAAAGEVPAAADLAEGTPAEAATVLGEHAAEVQSLGVGMVFGPVADVGTGAGLGTRTFGDDPATVADFVTAIVEAQTAGGVVSVVKHWPGIGGGDEDPHEELTRLDDVAELRNVDLVPFDRAIAAGVPAVMVAHAEVPGLTAPDEPASLSAAAITGELRGRQGFAGLVITDELGMGAVLESTDQVDAAVRAVRAGADVALLSGTDVVPEAHAALVAAIGSGELPRDQVVASVRRVLSSKGLDGGCLDAVATYSALARAASTTTVAGQGTAASTTTTTTRGTGR
jgi:beta-N-acetylhexosaminidase